MKPQKRRVPLDSSEIRLLTRAGVNWERIARGRRILTDTSFDACLLEWTTQKQVVAVSSSVCIQRRFLVFARGGPCLFSKPLPYNPFVSFGLLRPLTAFERAGIIATEFTDMDSRRKTLSTLDQNQLSSIPQPSARKPSRPSHIPTQQQVPRTAYHNRASSYGVPAESTPKTKSSFAPGASHGVVNGRRSSLYTAGRQSSVGALGFFSQSSSQAPNKDLRPVRDKQYQQQCIRHIVDYLQSSGYPHQVVQKTLQTPTQKEFVSIFKYLYAKLDPRYHFVKKIDEDVQYCMKALKYPFASDISRSQLAAVGSPHSWPNMLAMLSWLVETIVMTDKLLTGEIEPEEVGDNHSEKIFFNYLTKAYQVFLAGADDFSEMEKELEQAFDKRNGHILSEIERLGDDNDRLEKELADMNETQPPLQNLEKERQILHSDKTKFREYIAKLESKRDKLRSVNERILQQLEEAENELQKLTSQKLDYQRQVDAQDISATDVEKMNSEHENLIKNLDFATNQVQEASLHIFERERLAQQKLDQLDRSIQTYNSVAYKIGIIPASALNAKGLDFEVDFSSPLERGVSWLGCRPEQLVNIELRNFVKPALSRLRQDLGTQVHQYQDEHIQLGELLDQVNEGLNDKKEELEALEARLGATIEQFNEIRDVCITDLVRPTLTFIDDNLRKLYFKRSSGETRAGASKYEDFRA